MTKSGGGREASGITDGAGKLEIRDLKAGKYYAVVNAPGVVTPLAYIDLTKSRADSFEEQLAGFPPIVVNGVSDLVAEIPAKRGGAIGGRISYANGDPAIGVKVEILRKVGDEYLTTLSNFSVIGAMLNGGAGTFQTDDRGVYRFAGLPAGEYIVKASENVVHSTNRRNTYDDMFESMFIGGFSMVTVFFQDAFDKTKAQILTVEFGQELVEINIVIPDRGLHSVEGKVVSAKDKLPIRNARLSIQRVGDEAAEEERYGRNRQVSYSADEGEWKFVELPAGRYKLTVEAENSEFDEAAKAYGVSANYGANTANAAANVMAPGNYPVGRQPDKPPARKFARQIKEFTIEDKDLSAQVIELTYGATISGSVKAEGKDDLPEVVTISVTDIDSDLTSSTTVYSGDYEGGSNGRLKTKDFKIEGVTSGKVVFTIHINDREYYVKKAMAGSTDILLDAVDLKEAEDLRGVQIVLAKDTGTLKATIVDGQKQPVPGMQITLVPTDPSKYRNSSFYRTARSDENGELEIKLPPFEYAVLSLPDRIASKRRDDLNKWLADAIKQAQTFKIEAGKTQKVTIKLESKKAEP
jgi:hypothetical protein